MSGDRERVTAGELDALEALRSFSVKVKRMKESSAGFDSTFAPNDCLTVTFLVAGSFGVADDLFEAIRVLGGHKAARIDAKEEAP